MATQFETATEPTLLKDRIARARAEGRTQQALEFARQLHKKEPTPENKLLLRAVTMERGEHLGRQGHLKDAVQLFTNALNLDDSLETKLEIACRLAKLGTLGPAVGLLRAMRESPEKTRLLGVVVDGAIRLGAQGKAHLPENLHPGFDAIWQAFSFAEQGKDDAAREAVQTIGLQSPYLEWKVLLRGLIAYYNNDDLKARENWQRLDPQRTPFAIAAPLRLRVDREFSACQSPEHIKAAEELLDRSASSGLAVLLRNLQKLFNQPKRLSDALRMAEQLLPTLKKEHPHLVPRLQHCFFWAIIERGGPDYLSNYYRVFGPRVEDGPNLERLQALAVERHDEPEVAQRYWLLYERYLEQNASRFSPGHAEYLRALVWERAGNLATKVDRAKPERSAEECYQRSVALAPKRLAPHLALFQRALDDPRQASKVLAYGAALLEHFPEHAPTLETLGDLELAKDHVEESLGYYQRAMQANPLERRLRNKLGQAYFSKAMAMALARRKPKNHQAGAPAEDFRVHIEQALGLFEGTKTHLMCRWAFLERLLGNELHAQQLEAQALAMPHQGAAARYALLCEAARAKFKPAQRQPFLDALLQAIADQPTAEEILALLETASLERVPAFPNQSSIEKHALTALKRFDHHIFSEGQLQSLCLALQRFNAVQPWERAVRHARTRFQSNPFFVLSHFDWMVMKAKGSSRPPRFYVLEHLLQIARDLVQSLPREIQETVGKQIDQRAEALKELEDSFGKSFSEIFRNIQRTMRRRSFDFYEEEDDEDL